MNLVTYGQHPDQLLSDFVEDSIVSDLQFPRRKRIRSHLLTSLAFSIRINLQELSNAAQNDSLFPDRVRLQILVGAWDEFDFESHTSKLPFRRRIGKPKNLPIGMPKRRSEYLSGVGPGGEEVVGVLGLGFVEVVEGLATGLDGGFWGLANVVVGHDQIDFSVRHSDNALETQDIASLRGRRWR